MDNVIPFPHEKKYDENIRKLKELSDSFDDLIISALVEQGFDSRDVAGILAHRLGSVMRNMQEKGQLWDVCERVLKRQAALD